MAEIKIYRSETQRNLPQGTPLSLQAPDQGIVGRAASQFGEALGAVGEARAQMAASSRAAAAHKSYQNDMLGVERASRRMKPEDAEVYYLQHSQNAYDKANNSLSSSYAKSLFATPAGLTANNSRKDFYKRNDAQLASAAIAGSNDEAQNYSRLASDITKEPRDRAGNMFRMFGQIEAQYNFGLINGEQAAARRRALAQDTLKNILMRQMHDADSPMDVVDGLFDSDDPVVSHLIDKEITGTERDKFVREQRATAVGIETRRRQQAAAAVAAATADRAAKTREAVRQRDKAHERIFDMIFTGVDPDTKEPVTNSMIVEQIALDARLEPFGQGSKNALIKMMRLATKGKNVKEQDASRRAIQTNLFRIAATGLDAAGKPVSREQFRRMALSEDSLEIFGKGSAATLIALNDARLAREATGLGGAQDAILRMIVERADANGNPMTSAQLNEAIMESPDLKAMGTGSKAAFLDMVRLNDQRTAAVKAGEKTAEDAAAERATHIEMYKIAVTGLNAKGDPVSVAAFTNQLLSEESLAVFGAGSANTLIKLRTALAASDTKGAAERKKAASVARGVAAQEEALRLVTSRRDADGDLMNTTQTNLAILEMTDLKATGTGSKAAFLKMVIAGDKAMMEDKTDGYQEDALNRLHLPADDPRHLTAHQLRSPEWTERLGYTQSRQLAKDAEGLLDEKRKPIIEAKMALFVQFKSTITDASLLTTDPKGDELFGAFKQRVDKVIEEAEKRGEDPMEYFDDSNKKYLGHIVKNYLRTSEAQRRGVRGAFGNQRKYFKPYTSQPVTRVNGAPRRRKDEAPADYLKRAREWLARKAND